MKLLTQQKSYPWLVLTLSASFLFYKYILQISPSVMTNDLMQSFHLSGAGLGNLAASYFYSYLVVQLFAGPLLDKFSPRVLTAFAMALCGLGALGFADSSNIDAALLSRALMGAGAAFATVSYLKMASVWFRPDQFAVVSGLLATAAMAGSMAAQVPMSWLVHSTNWQSAMLYVAILGLILASLFYIFVRNQKEDLRIQKNNLASIKWNDILNVVKTKHNWYLALYTGLAFSPLAVLGGLWGNPFFEEAYHFSPTAAAGVSTAMFLGLAFGAPFFAMLSNRLNKRYLPMQLGVLLSLIALGIVVYSANLSVVVIAILLFLFGFGVGAFMLGFTVGKELNSLAVAATVVAFLNTGDAILGAVTEPFIGKVLDLFWTGGVRDGVHYFAAYEYHIAFSILLVYLISASILLKLLKTNMDKK